MMSHKFWDDFVADCVCTQFRLFESTRMKFGFGRAFASFQRFTDEVIRELPGLYSFKDDIFVAHKKSDKYHGLKSSNCKITGILCMH